MNMKKTLTLVLALVMVMGLLAGCGGDEPETQPQTQPVKTEPAETEPVETEPVETEPVETQPATTQPQNQPAEVYDPGTALNWKVGEVTDEGYGRTAITLNNGVTFRVGDPLSDLVAAGMELDEDDAAVTLAPWAHYTIYLYYTDDAGEYYSVDLNILNDSSEARLVSDCRIFSTRIYDDGVALDNGIVIGQTTTEEALALFGTDDEYDLVLGTSVNMLEASTSSSDKVVYAVELTYLDHILDARTDSNGEDASELSVLEHYGMGDYDNYANMPNLEEVLGISELQLTIAGDTVTFGPNGNTWQSLADLGWNLRELDEDDQQLESGRYLVMFMTPATVDGYGISALDIGNYTEETINTADSRLKGIDLENPLYFATENPDAAPFDFYGITAESTIQDVIDILGEPDSAYVYLPNCSIDLTYNFEGADDSVYSTYSTISITFDFMTNQLVTMTIS